MTNLFKIIAEFWLKVWHGTCSKAVSLCRGAKDKTMWVCRRTKDIAVSLPKKASARCASFGRRVVSVKDRIANNRLLPGFVAKCRELAIYADENRKVCYPVILLVYTVVVVIVTTSINFGMVFSNRNAEQTGQLSGDMVPAQTYASIVYLEQGQPLSVEGEFSICYDGYKFDKKITPSNAEKFGAYYENHSDANLYLDVMLTYTNSTERSVRGDDAVRAVATCAGVAYNSFIAVETEQGTNFEFAADKDISPGESVQVHCIFDVPATMENTSHAVNVEITTDNKTYYIDVR